MIDPIGPAGPAVGLDGVRLNNGQTEHERSLRGIKNNFSRLVRTLYL